VFISNCDKFYLHQYLNINGKPENRTKMARHVARMEEKRNASWVLVWKHKRKRPLRTPRQRLHENIKIDLEATEWEIVD
jgi:hypothetical protein